MNKIRIAFSGYAGAGKDTAASGLIKVGFKRVCFGDIIKRQLDPMIRENLGFSAFTEDRCQKRLIRGVLEQWGEANYDAITEEFFRELPDWAVNTRLVRIREAKRWIEAGGYIIIVERPGVEPATQWEADRVRELSQWVWENPGSGTSISNNGSVEDLLRKVDIIVNDQFSEQGRLLRQVFEPAVAELPAPESVIGAFMASQDWQSKLVG